jgi:hypothetical protein
MNLLVKSRSQSDYLASTNRSQPKQLPFSTFLVLYLLPRFFLAWILPPGFIRQEVFLLNIKRGVFLQDESGSDESGKSSLIA